MDKVTPHEGQECATHKYNKAQEHTARTQYGTSLRILLHLGLGPGGKRAASAPQPRPQTTPTKASKGPCRIFTDRISP